VEDAVPVEDSILMDVTDDMYCGALSPDMISDFVCMLCYGIVYDPIKCSQCSNLVCKKCVNMKSVQKGRQSCFKKCGSRKFEELSKIE